MKHATSQKIVIIEQNLAYRDYLRTTVSEEGMLSFCFENETTCLDNLDVLDPDLLVIGSLDTNGIFRLLNALQLVKVKFPVLLINTNSDVREYIKINCLNDITVADASKALPKLGSVARTFERMPEKNMTGKRPPAIVGNTPALIEIKKALPELSRSTESVLIKGEKGVGKEIIARWIHFNSTAREGVFIKIDTRALLDENTEWCLLEFLSTLPVRDGKNAAKDTTGFPGTLYFDEVFDLSSDLQAELLLILEDSMLSPGCFGLKSIPEYRIIAGTHRNAEKLITQNRFRKDLYYRLNVLNLTVPPLRERKEDISLLTDFFVYKYCRETNKSYFKLSREVMNVFNAYDWPDNVDELENTVRRAVMARSEKRFLAGFYDKQKKHERMQNISRDSAAWVDRMLDPKDYLAKIDTMSLKDICWDCLADVEKNIMKKALDQTNWNRKKAADMLAISYKSMLNKIKEYGLA